MARGLPLWLAVMSRATASELPVDLYSSCPPLGDLAAGLERAIEVARWSDRAGCRGILVYTDNRQLDPWLVAQVIIQATDALSPLVAVQPAYMHPYSVAKMVTSLAHLHDRRVDLNLVAGGFRNDLAALDDRTPHDRRYARLVEYASIVRALLDGAAAVSFEGEFYRVSGLRLTPPLAPALRGEFFVSGSSEAGRQAARALDALAVEYPEPGQLAGAPGDEVRRAIRLGVIARPDSGEAWEIARRRFPVDRRGVLTHQLAAKVTDSVWFRRLSALEASGSSPYWLVPFQSYGAMCPYLVGSYVEVGRELNGYLRLGVRAVILDAPREEDDLWHVREAVAAEARPALAVAAATA